MAEVSLIELPTDCVRTTTELFGGLRLCLRIECECDAALIAGGVLVRRQLVDDRGALLDFWSRLQTYAWCGDERTTTLQRCLRARVNDITRGLLPLVNPAASTQHGYNVLGAMRQCAFSTVCKVSRLASCGAGDQKLTPAACGLGGASYGAENLDDAPIESFGPHRALAVADFLCRTHGAFVYTEMSVRFLNGLLRRVCDICVMLDDDEALASEGTVSMMESIAQLTGADTNAAVVHKLLIQAEILFAGLQRDAGALDTLPGSVLPMPGGLQPPLAESSKITVRLLTELFTALAQRKEVQRIAIEARECMIASVLCTYGRESDRRHGLVEEGRRNHVVLYDRLCYKPLAKLVDANGELCPDLEQGRFECRAGSQAAVFGTVLAVTHVQYGNKATAWLRARARWAPWPSWGSEGPLRCRRVLDQLVDSQGETHSTLLTFLAKSIEQDTESAPHALRVALADRGWRSQ